MAVAAALAFSLAVAAPLSSFAADDKVASGNASGERPQIWKGRIASLQLSGTKVDWVMSGAWILRAPAGESLKDVKNPSFLAAITMVKPDGTALHRHRISNLSISNATINGGNISLQGTATVTMTQGPVQGVPIKIEMNSAVVAIWVGPEKVSSHFGGGPIYGTLAAKPAAAPSEAPAAPASIASPTENPMPAATQSNSTSTSNTNSTSSISGTNSTQASNNPVPAASGSKQGNVIQMAAKDSVNLYGWFVGAQENPTIEFAANADNTISIQNPTDTKHHLVIESNGKQVESSGDIGAGSSGQLTYRPTSAGTLDYYCQYHSTMKGTIQVK